MVTGERKSKKHHYVPQLILRGFAKDGQVATYDLVDQRRYVQEVSDAAAENDYNTVEIDGTKTDHAERAMAAIEDAAAPALARIAAGGWVSPADKTRVARFLALQYVRVPRNRAHSDGLADQVMKLEIAAAGPEGLKEAMAESGREPPSDDEVQSAWRSIRDFDWTATLPREHHVVDSLRMLDELSPMLVDLYSWCVIRWQRRTILTGDVPVLLTAARDWPAWRGVGLGTAGTIYFAISRTCALVLANARQMPNLDGVTLPATVQGARAINQLTTQAANCRVYLHPDDDIADLVAPTFAIPVPTAVDLETAHAAELRRNLVAANEYAFEHPDEPHPLAGLASVSVPPPNARPLRVRRPGGNLGRSDPA